MPKLRKSEKRSDKYQGPERVLIECSPYRTTGGRFIEGLTPYPIEHESHNERHALWLLPLCHDVLQIQTQASKERYTNEAGELCTHVPDITVLTPTGTVLIEVKSLSWLVKEKELNKYLQIARGYLLQKKRFAFLVDVQLMQQPLFQSVNLLSRYSNCEIIPSVSERVVEQLQAGPMQIRELIEVAWVELVDVYVLIARKVITCDWSERLDIDSRVSLLNQPYERLKLEKILRSTRYGDLLAQLALGRRPADQSVLEDAENWRQPRKPLNPFQFLGGFSKGAPLRDLREGESRTSKSWKRRDFAPGYKPRKTDVA